MFALVTGAGGFLGRYLAERLLARGDRVRSFARGEYDFLERLGVEQMRGDLRDAAAVARAVQGTDVVFHTAAAAGIGESWDYFYGINTLGTRHVIEACRKHGVAKLIYTSSPSVTFSGEDQCGVAESEDYPARYLAHYPRSKAIAERETLAASDANLLTCALRPHLIWGPRDQHLIPRLIDRARKGMLRRIGSGKNLVDMIYVENAAEAHLQAAEALSPGSPACGKACYLSQGTPVNCWDWIDEILALAKLPPVRRSVPYGVAYYAGAILEATYALLRRTDEPRMTRFLAAQLAKHHYYDLTRARRDFGYRPAISTEEGMRRLGEWMRTELLAR